MNIELNVSPPWVTFIKKVTALFKDDGDIRIEIDESSKTPNVKLYVASARKAAALEKLLPNEVRFGNVTCRVTIVPGNGDAGEFGTQLEVLEAAFTGNPAVAVIRPMSKGLFKDLVYVAFRKEVVQFFNDDLADINGNWSGLYADIAKEIMSAAVGVYFCTSADDGFGAPLGEWP